MVSVKIGPIPTPTAKAIATPQPISTERCSIDLTDLADIFTVDSPHRVRNKLKISAQTDEPFFRYTRYKYEGIGYI